MLIYNNKNNLTGDVDLQQQIQLTADVDLQHQTQLNR
jgi:hypothetical protein